MDKQALCDIYNNSDIEALLYMLPCLDGDLKKLCERLIYLNDETQIGWGDKDYSPEEFDEYYEGKWELLNFFGIKNVHGDAEVEV